MICFETSLSDYVLLIKKIQKKNQISYEKYDNFQLSVKENIWTKKWKNF